MIPVNQPLLNGNERKYLNECIESGWISSEGPFVQRLEEQFALRVGRKHGIAVCNGSAALDIAVAALDLGVGDRVIMPSFTIISCAASLIRAGATPVLIDSDPVTWNMDMDQLKARIEGEAGSKKGSRLKAIMVVHIYGLPCDMQPLLEIAEKYDLRVIEDAAEMHGQTYRGKPCGSFGDISIFSFYPNKHVTTGEGGIVVTDNPDIAERCRSLRNLCFQPKRRFVHDELGWNFRMSNLQAAVGCAQLERLDEFVKIKRRMGVRYTEMLSDIPVLQLPLPRTDYAENIYWVYGILLNDEAALDAAGLARCLARGGIGTRPFFWPMHRQPVFQRMGLFGDECYPVSEQLGRCGLYLPSGLALTDRQIEQVCGSVRDALG